MNTIPEGVVDAVGVRPFKVRINPTSRPSADDPVLLQVVDADLAAEQGCERVQLLEGREYRYEISGLDEFRPIETDLDDIIVPDHPDDGRSGHLKPGNRVGLLPVQLSSSGVPIGQFAVEIRSRKLDYLTDFRWMLRDIAAQSVGMLLQDFAPTHVRLESDPSRSPESAYEIFRLIDAVLRDPIVVAAIYAVINRPHADWSKIQESRQPGRGLADIAGVRSLLKAGPRVPWPGEHALTTLPARLPYEHSVEDLDTLPNRFVKYVLEDWSAKVAALKAEVDQLKDGPTRRRAVGEIDAVLQELGIYLDAPLFRAVGRLSRLPANSQVLLKRSGYRELLLAFAMVESGLMLRSGPLPGLTAGQRDVPKLYEYWVFIWLAEAVKAISSSLDDEPIRNGEIAGGRRSCTSGLATRLGRRLRLRLCYNRGFGRAAQESWSADMRPDVSLEISLDSAFPRPESTWLHFDAKYRITKLSDWLNESEEPAHQAVRDDVLKMHAYKDAIRGSGGAFVVYPGTKAANRGELAIEDVTGDEILPSVGAFQLTPSDLGEPLGFESLKAHLEQALVHYASTATRDRRSRYWAVESYSDPTHLPLTGLGDLLRRPPADVPVLLGYVRSPEQWAWINESGLYNLRAGDRPGSVTVGGPELACDFVLLYGESAGAQIREVRGGPISCDQQRMLELGYPNPRQTYFCIALGPEVSLGAIDRAAVERRARELARRSGVTELAPVVTSLLDVIELRLRT